MMRPILLLLVVSLFGARATGAKDTGELTLTRAADRSARLAPTENFTATARVQPLFAPTDMARAFGAVVSFEAGARTAWHTHPRGQVLIVTEGVGRVQRWGGPIEEIREGDVVQIGPGVKHWHGAAPTTAMAHIAIVESLESRSADWMEQVSDAQYGATDSATGPSVAQRVMGDIAPKLAQLTDSVLFGDVWARPGLSRRDRSLVTVSALIAMNRSDQRRSHLTLARQNCVSRDELVEAITQLAFYAGWPSAVTAVGVARDVLAATRP